MNILIIGEFSGFAKHLKNGFQQLGHNVVNVHTGDSWKKISDVSDVIYSYKHWYILGCKIPGSSKLCNIITNIKLDRLIKRRCPNPDIIVVINFSFLRKNITWAGVSRSMIVDYASRGAKIIMSECGDGCALAYRHKEYYKMMGRKLSLHDKRYDFLLKYSHIIIPTIFMYYDQLIAYDEIHPYDTSKVSKPIPLPITIEKEEPQKTCVGRKIVIFHGIIRPIAKGTPFIKEAMERIERELPDKVECVCVGGLPYDEYLKVFNRVDILIDQTYGNGWGMNAAIGAMKGKCVLAPCGSENGEIMGIPNIPFVQIGPDSEMIYQRLKDLVLNPEKIDAIKEDSRRFAEEYCDCRIIAGRYLKVLDNLNH